MGSLRMTWMITVTRTDQHGRCLSLFYKLVRWIGLYYHMAGYGWDGLWRWERTIYHPDPSRLEKDYGHAVHPVLLKTSIFFLLPRFRLGANSHVLTGCSRSQLVQALSALPYALALPPLREQSVECSAK